MNMHRLNDDLNPRNERQTDARRVTVDDNDTYNGGGACATHTTLEIEARRRTTRCAHIFLFTATRTATCAVESKQRDGFPLLGPPQYFREPGLHPQGAYGLEKPVLLSTGRIRDVIIGGDPVDPEPDVMSGS